MMNKAIIFVALTVCCFFRTERLFADTLYDDFSTNYVKKSMWLDYYHGGLHNEIAREIANGALVLKLGTNEIATPLRQGLTVKQPVTLSTLKADVKVVEMNNDPSDSATVFARIGGILYNTGTSAPTCLQHDVWVELCLGDKGDGLQAWYEVEAFDTCSNQTANLLRHATLPTGPLQADHFYTLEIDYNGDNELTVRIYDTANPSVPLAEDHFTGPPRTYAPWGQATRLQACVHDDPGEFLDGYVHAEFDEVFLNGAAYDDFSDPEIDMAKWSNFSSSISTLEYVRESNGDHARLYVKSQDVRVRSRLPLRDRYTPLLKANVRIESGSVVSAGGMGRVRLAGYFYNELYGPGSYNGYEGDVWAHVSLQLDDSGTLFAVANLSASNVDESSYTTLFDAAFPTTISFDTDYVLSINFTGTGFEFACDNDALTYSVATQVNPPSNAFRVVESRTYLDSGESAFIKGRIDDVYVSSPAYANLSGLWMAATKNSQVIEGSCSPDRDDSTGLLITQNNCEITGFSTFGGQVAGVISGSRLLLQGSDVDEGSFIETFVDMTFSDMHYADGLLANRQNDGCIKISDIELLRSMTTGGSNDPGSEPSSDTPPLDPSQDFDPQSEPDVGAGQNSGANNERSTGSSGCYIETLML